MSFPRPFLETPTFGGLFRMKSGAADRASPQGEEARSAVANQAGPTVAPRHSPQFAAMKMDKPMPVR